MGDAHIAPYIILIYAQRIVFGRKFEHLGNLGISSLAAYLEDKGFRARAFTGITTDAADIFESEFQKTPVSAAGFYCDYDNQSCVEKMSRYFKNKYGVKIIVGGPQTINLGEDFMKSSRCDFMVRGDGEASLLELMEYIGFGRGGLENIKGLVYIDESGALKLNEPREVPDAINSYPLPSSSFELGNRKKYNISVISARGCPFRCAFCYEGGNTKKLRLRSIEKVIDEIRRGLDENPDAKYVWFVDDTFTLNYPRTREFCAALSRLRKERHFVWFCEGHAALLSKNPDLVEMMVDAGMARMQVGMESGCGESLESYRKQTTPEEIEEVVRICRRAGLGQLAGNFIMGGAKETPETLERTAAFVEGLHDAAPGMIDISTTFIMPLPNTAISKCPRDFGITILDPGSLTTTEDFPVNETDGLSRFEISMAARKFLSRSAARMSKLYKNGSVPREYVRRHFELSHKYGLSSTWYRFLYSRDPVVKQYYEMMILSRGVHSDGVAPEIIESYYPCRTFDISPSCGYFKTRPVMDESKFIGLERDLVDLCDGRTRLGAVMASIVEKHRETPGAAENARRILKEMEEKHLVIFLP